MEKEVNDRSEESIGKKLRMIEDEEEGRRVEKKEKEVEERRKKIENLRIEIRNIMKESEGILIIEVDEELLKRIKILEVI